MDRFTAKFVVRHTLDVQRITQNGNLNVFRIYIFQTSHKGIQTSTIHQRKDPREESKIKGRTLKLALSL